LLFLCAIILNIPIVLLRQSSPLLFPQLSSFMFKFVSECIPKTIDSTGCLFFIQVLSEFLAQNPSILQLKLWETLKNEINIIKKAGNVKN